MTDTEVHALIPLFTALPLAAAFIVPLVAAKREAVADWLANLTLLALVIIGVLTFGEQGLYEVGGWAAPIGIVLRLDPLASLMLVSVAGVGLAAGLYSIDYMRQFTAKDRYYSLFLIMMDGMNGVILAGDLFNLYVMLEIAAIASYGLVAFGCRHEELEASFKYAVLGTVSSTFILIGVALVYGVTGNLNLTHIAARINDTGMSLPLLFALALFVGSFGLKSALVPFHAWLPDAHPSAPAPVSAMLSGVLIKAIGIYVLARLIFNVFGAGDGVLTALRWLAVISMVAGSLLAMAQTDIKRLFAYSSISQVGYVVLGLGLGTPLGIVGALYHLVNHAAFKSLLFLNAGAVEYATGSRDLGKLGGLNRALPVSGGTSLIASMSIAGIPPLNGFWSKLIIIVAAVEAGFIGFAIAAAVVSIVTLAYQLKVQRGAFFTDAPADMTIWRDEPRSMALAMILLAVICLALSLLVIGGLHDPLFIGPAVETLLAGPFAP